MILQFHLEICGNMIVDIGGGTTDVAVISLGGTVVSTSIKVAGDNFDEAIMRYVRKNYNLIIGERTAEEIKINVATVHTEGRQVEQEVRGRDLVTGLPTTIKVTSEDGRKALRESVASLVASVRSVLEKCPPELSADIVDKGIYLTGGGALLDGISQVLKDETGIDTYVAEQPLDCVALGTGKALIDLNKLRPGSIVGNGSL